MKTFAQKKIQRKIARASRRGRYLVSRKGRRDRPGRKKSNKQALEDAEWEKDCMIESQKQKTEKAKMHIPKMSEK